jgi:CheY-like chemotaxis protein
VARILLVDDNPQIREVLEAALVQHGHQVVPARDGKEGMKLLRQSQCDVVLTDILMPEKDGLQLLREVRAEFPTMRVVAMSGGSPHQPGSDALRTASKFGADAVLHKPFTVAEAIAAIVGEKGP